MKQYLIAVIIFNFIFMSNVIAEDYFHEESGMLLPQVGGSFIKKDVSQLAPGHIGVYYLDEKNKLMMHLFLNPNNRGQDPKLEEFLAATFQGQKKSKEDYVVIDQGHMGISLKNMKHC